ncbi:MAG: HEAT repeat domain-containing protein [Thermodesulfobacteriota bacterium]
MSGVMGHITFRALIAGLVMTQIVASTFVFLSNQEILTRAQSIESAGYLVVPGPAIWPALTSFRTAFNGGMFFTFSSGAGITVVSLALAWLYGRLLGRPRWFKVAAFFSWIFCLALANGGGGDPLLTCLVLLIPPTIFVVTRSWPRLRLEDRPWRVWMFFLAGMIIIGAVWGSQAREDVFLDVRDFVFWSNPAGRTLSDVYYRYTLYPTELFLSLKQKTLRTVRLPEHPDPDLIKSLTKAFLKNDYLPLPRVETPDLEVEIEKAELSFRQDGRLILQPDIKPFLTDPGRFLDRYSILTDRHRFFRRVTYLSLLAGLPLALYIFFFSLGQWLFGLFLSARGAAVAACLICLFLGLGLLAPLLYGRAAAQGPPADLIKSDSWWRRASGLKAVENDRLEIHDFPYQRLLNSPRLTDRYWLAVALGASRRPETFPDLIRLLDDPDPNVACMAYRSLALRKAVRTVPDIRRRIEVSDHWYLQWYAYRALKDLGWTQGSN